MLAAERIADADDPRLAEYRVVKERDLLRARGVFIAEGSLVVERLLSPRCRFSVRSLLVLDTKAAEFLPLAVARGGGFPVFVASRALMDEIVGFRFHQGCLAVGEIGAEPSPGSVLDSLPPSPAVAVLEDLVDLDNVGSVFRNAAGLGADAVLLSPRCADPLYRKSIRTSMGHALLLPFARVERWPYGLADLRARGMVVIALTPGEAAEPIGRVARRLAEASPRPGVALLLGTEGEGLSREAMAAADVRVRIPMAQGVDSINIATACAVALHRLARPDEG